MTMRRVGLTQLPWSRVSLVVLLAACGEEIATPRGPIPGSLRVGVTVTGFLPPRDLTVLVDDTLTLRVEGATTMAVYRSATISEISPGTHLVAIADLDPNCTATAPRLVHVGSDTFTHAELRVSCTLDAATVGTGLAWIGLDDEGWGNSQLVLLSPDGTLRVPVTGWDATDVAWSGRGDLLAVATPDEVHVLGDQGARQVGFLSLAAPPSAVAWVPGGSQLSLLYLWETGCRITFFEAPWGALTGDLPCEGRGTGNDRRGDLAWSPDGRTAAVSSRGDGRVSLLSAATGVTVNLALPDARHRPVAVTWSPSGDRLLAATLCVQECAPDRLALMSYEPGTARWSELASWPTTQELWLDQGTLEFVDPGRLVVGPIGGTTALVPLDRPADWRFFLAGEAWRVARRPDG